MYHHLSANNLLNQFQSAYRPGHSTKTALLKIVNDLLISLDDGDISLLASLDLSAAFDTIDHNIFLHRLQHDFGLSGRIQYVSVHSLTSGSASVSCGVPQGSALGPIHFVLYTTPIAAVIERHSIIHHSYADDSKLQNSATPDRLHDVIDSMRFCIDDLEDWMTDNKLKLNDDKTEVMIISSSRMSTALSIPDSIEVGNASVRFSDTITLDSHLSLNIYVFNLVRIDNFELRRISSIRGLLTILGLGISKREHISRHLASLHWLPIDSLMSLLSDSELKLTFSVLPSNYLYFMRVFFLVLYQLYCWISCGL